MKHIWNNYRSSFWLILSMLLGGAIGFVWGEGASVLQPVADTFLNLLYCSVVPLIFCSLSSAIARMTDLSKLKKIVSSFMVGTIGTGLVACLFMVGVCLLINPAEGAQLTFEEPTEPLTGSMNILAMFTVSDFTQLFSRTNLMALIVFTVLFAVALIQVGERAKPVVQTLEVLTDVVLKIIGLIMKIAPLGLGCYFAILMGSHGRQVVGPLSRAILLYLVVILVYFVVSQTVMAYIGAGRKGVKRWWQTCVPAAMTALGTCSSAASLPANMVQASQLGIPKQVADLVLPLGANLHKDGSCLIQVMKIAFLCSVFDIPFATPRNLILAVVVALVASLVVGGIPAGGYVAELFILSAFGFPAVSVPIMVLLGTITDALSTVVNVTGDTGLAMMVSRFVEGKNWMEDSNQPSEV